MDVYQGMDFKTAYANTNPTWDKIRGGRRLSFVVDIPDYLIEPVVDFKVQESSIAEEVK